MIVYGSSMSPFVRKVLAFAAEKGVEVESRPLGLGSDDPEFREASPFGKIPALRDGGFALSDSTAIVFYLDALKAEPELIPADAKTRARAVWWDEFSDTIFAPCGAKMFFNRIVAPRFLGREGDLAAADKAEGEELPKLLDWLEGAIPERPFLLGDRLTLADIALASPFANLRHLGIRPDPDRHPRVTRFAEAMLDRPSFAKWVGKETAFFERMAAAAAAAPTPPAGPVA